MQGQSLEEGRYVGRPLRWINAMYQTLNRNHTTTVPRSTINHTTTVPRLPIKLATDWQQKHNLLMTKFQVIKGKLQLSLSQFAVQVTTTTGTINRTVTSPDTRPSQCIGIQPFVNLSQLLTGSWSDESFMMVPQTAQEYHVDPHTHKRAQEYHVDPHTHKRARLKTTHDVTAACVRANNTAVRSVDDDNVSFIYHHCSTMYIGATRST